MTASHEPRPTQVGYQYQQSRPAQFPYQHYPSQQYLGQYHQPGPAPEQFNNRNNKNGDNKKLPTWAKVTAGGLAITAAVGGGLFAKSQFDSADRAEKGYNTPGELSYETRPDGLTADNATVEQFYNPNYFSDVERVTWADEQLRSPSTDPEYPNMTVEQAAYNRINANLAKSNGLQLGKEFSGLVEPSVDNTPAEVDTQMYVATAAALFEPDLDKAKKMLAAVADNDSELYRSLAGDIEEFRATNPTQEEFYSQTAAYYFTPWDKNSAPELKPQATGISDSAEQPLGTVVPVDGTPTYVAMQRASQDIVRAKNRFGGEYEAVHSFVAGRWIEREQINKDDVGRWIPPEELVTIQVK